MNNQLPRNRLFSDIYDNVTQSYTVDLDQSVLRPSYIARLRLDGFLREKIVIVDVDIFDGALFLDAAVNSFWGDLPLKRMEVRLRASSFGDAILSALGAGRNGNLKDFYFNSLPPELANQVQNELRSFPSSSLDNWRKIPLLLNQIGVPSTLAEKYEEAWAKWSEVIDERKIHIGYWSQPTAKFTFNGYFLGLLRKQECRNGLSKFGKSVLDNIMSWEDRYDRSKVIGEITRQSQESLGPRERIELVTIEDWYNSAYNETRAKHHSCACVENTYRSNAIAFNRELDLVDQATQKLNEGVWDFDQENTLYMPQELVQGLATLDRHSYDQALAEREIKNPLYAWYETQTEDALRSATDKLVRRIGVSNIKDVTALSTKVIPNIRLIAGKVGSATAKAGGRIGAGIGALFMLTGHGDWSPPVAGNIVGKALPTAAAYALKASAYALAGLDNARRKFDNHAKHERVVQWIIDHARDARQRDTGEEEVRVGTRSLSKMAKKRHDSGMRTKKNS